MERRDFVMKQIEKIAQLLGKVLADLMKLKSQASQYDGLAILQQVFHNELHLDLEELIQTSSEDFLDTVTGLEGFDNKNIAQLADVLLDVADHLPEENHLLYEKCLALYEYLDRSEGTYSFERQGKIEHIKSII